MCVQGSTWFGWPPPRLGLRSPGLSLLVLRPLFWALVTVPPARGQLQLLVATAPSVGRPWLPAAGGPVPPHSASGSQRAFLAGGGACTWHRAAASVAGWVPRSAGGSGPASSTSSQEPRWKKSEGPEDDRLGGESLTFTADGDQREYPLPPSSLPSGQPSCLMLCPRNPGPGEGPCPPGCRPPQQMCVSLC